MGYNLSRRRLRRLTANCPAAKYNATSAVMAGLEAQSAAKCTGENPHVRPPLGRVVLTGYFYGQQFRGPPTAVVGTGRWACSTQGARPAEQARASAVAFPSASAFRDSDGQCFRDGEPPLTPAGGTQTATTKWHWTGAQEMSATTEAMPNRRQMGRPAPSPAGCTEC